MDVAQNDKVSDVMKRIPSGDDTHVTSGGRVLRGSDKLTSCGVSGWCTIQVTSRMRGGGKHKDKKSKAEKRQAANRKKSELLQRQQEEKCEEEQKNDEGPVTQRVDKDSVIRQLEESEGYQKIIECMSQGSECELERTVQNCLAYIQEVSRLDKEQLENFASEVRRAVEARRRGRGTERERAAEMEQGKEVRFVEEEERQAQSTDEKDVMNGLEEVRTGRARAGLVRGGDERSQANETSGKGKGKGEHGNNGDHAGKGFPQSVKMLKGEEEEKEYDEDERVQMAPNMEADGSHPQAMADPEEEEEEEASEEETKRMRRLRWAD